MEYSFINYTKNNKSYHILRIKDIFPVQEFPLHIEQNYEDIYDNMVVKHIFNLSEKIMEEIDVEGFWYIWYNMKEYERIIYERNMFELKEKGRWKYV